MWHLSILRCWHYGHILWLWSLIVQERHEDAHLQHVHELLIEGLFEHLGICKITSQDLNLVLVDQECYSHAILLDALHLVMFLILSLCEEVGRCIDTPLRKEYLLSLEYLSHHVVKLIVECVFIGELQCNVLEQIDSQDIVRKQGGIEEGLLAVRLFILIIVVHRLGGVLVKTLALDELRLSWQF